MSKIYILIFGACLCATTIQAQPELAPSDTLELDQIVITASKIQQSQRETTKPVLVINRAELEQNRGRDLGQILNQQSGIRVNNAFGSPANNRSMFLQGASQEFALILVDGLAINDPSGTGGSFDLRLLPVHNVERIEILKGSQSTLYGTDAIAGVVNIITKTGDEQPFNTSGSLSYGSFNTFKGSVGVHGNTGERVRYRVNYNTESSDGFSSAAPPEGAGEFEDDGYNLDSFNSRVDVKVMDGLTLSPFLNYTSYDGDYDADAFSDADNTFSLEKFNPGIQMEFKRNSLQLNGGYNFVKTDRLFVSQFGENEFEGSFHNADLYGVYDLSRVLKLIGGVNYQQSAIPGAEEAGNDITADLVSPYATIITNPISGLNAEIGYRLNNHSEYGSNSTFSFSPSYYLNDRVKIYGALNTGFKAPTLSELFGPFGANENLDPQTSRTLSAGFESYFMNQSLKIGFEYFNREVDDLIIFSPNGFINRDKQNDSGVEVTANWIASNRITIGGHYNYLEGEITTLDDAGEVIQSDGLLRRPTHSIGFNTRLKLAENLLIRLNADYNSERQDLFFNPANNFAQEEVTLDSYVLVNAYAEYRLMDGQVSLFTDIGNLLDTDYTEIYGFNTAGFNIRAGVSFDF